MKPIASIRCCLAAALLVAATQSQAGQDVPPPRAIHPVQPAFAPPPTHLAGPIRWRDTPPVMEHWSADRHVPIAGFGGISACEARRRAGVMADDGWSAEGDEFAGFDGDDFVSEWETLR